MGSDKGMQSRSIAVHYQYGFATHLDPFPVNLRVLCILSGLRCEQHQALLELIQRVIK